MSPTPDNDARLHGFTTQLPAAYDAIEHGLEVILTVHALTAVEKRVIEGRAAGATFATLAQELGVTRQRVHQIEQKARAKIDHPTALRVTEP